MLRCGRVTRWRRSPCDEPPNSWPSAARAGDPGDGAGRGRRPGRERYALSVISVRTRSHRYGGAMILRAPSNRDRRGVLSIKPFRRLWIALALSSLGDWLSILALTALAFQLTKGRGVATQSYAVGGVWIATLLPALLLGPFAGVVADRMDRRMSMLALVSKALGAISPYFNTNQVNLALYFNAATFAVSAITVFFIQIPKRRSPAAAVSAPSVAKTIWEGWRFLGTTPVVRGLVIGMIGAF